MPIYTSHLSSSNGMQVTGSTEIKGILMNKSSMGENGQTERIPADHNALLYGPMQTTTGSITVIEEGANLRIKDIQDA
jgi:hypothetical protein